MDSLLLNSLASQATGFLAAVALKATFVLGLAALVTQLLARRSAALRHGVWALAAAAILVLPVAQVLAPPLSAPIPFPIPHTSDTALEAAPGESPRSASPLPIGVPRHAPPSGGARTGSTFTWPVVALLAWLLGAVVVLAFFAAGRITLARVSAGARRIDDASWLLAARKIAERLGVRQPLRFLTSDSTVGPMTWGIIRPTILLPASAATWPTEQWRSFLLHELAHVARRDCAIQDLAHLACALYWFHPGAWYAAHRLRVERERACDDIVLADGASAESYAQQLLDVVRAARTLRGALSVSGAAMAAPSQLESRVRALLDESLDRHGVGARRAVVGGLLALVLTVPVAAFAPAPPPASARETGDPGPTPPADARRTLAERWQLAFEEGRTRFHGEDFWIGYAIDFRGRVGREGREERETLLTDSGNWDANDLEKRGPSLAERFGYGSEDAVILFRVRARNSGTSPSFERVAIRSAYLSPALEGLSVVSMGRIGTEESLDWLSTRLERAPEDRRAAVLVTALSLHDSPRTGPLLEKILEVSHTSEVRVQAAEGLGRHPGARALETLVKLARKDRSQDVRREAAETIGDLDYAPATNALIALCRELEDDLVRAESVETLGEREPERVVPVLVEISAQDPSEMVRREAVETLGDLPGNAGLEPLRRMAMHSEDPAVRSEAMETLNDLGQRARGEARRLD